MLARTSLASGEDLEGALASLDAFARTEALGPGDGIATRVLRARLLARLGRLGPARDEVETAVLVQPSDASLAPTAIDAASAPSAKRNPRRPLRRPNACPHP